MGLIKAGLGAAGGVPADRQAILHTQQPDSVPSCKVLVAVTEIFDFGNSRGFYIPCLIQAYSMSFHLFMTRTHTTNVVCALQDYSQYRSKT